MRKPLGPAAHVGGTNIVGFRRRHYRFGTGGMCPAPQNLLDSQEMADIQISFLWMTLLLLPFIVVLSVICLFIYFSPLVVSHALFLSNLHWEEGARATRPNRYLAFILNSWVKNLFYIDMKIFSSPMPATCCAAIHRYVILVPGTYRICTCVCFCTFKRFSS